jgi:hypothetical protein
MQAFPPEEGVDTTLILGGQVLVLDVTLAAAAIEPTVKMSYAGSGEGRPSPAMDVFFSRLVRGAVKQDGHEGGGVGRRLRDALGYLMRLDRLAAQEGNAGARWFGEVDALARELAKITQEEAALLAQCVHFIRFSFILPFGILSSRSWADGRVSCCTIVDECTHAIFDRFRGQPLVPLDILLLRGHALALPYLHSPSLCFLVHLSPRAYLSLQRSASANTTEQLLSIDIPLAHLYNCLGTDTPPPGVTRAALTLEPLQQTPSTSADPLLSSHPSFPLASSAIGFTHDFPLPTGTDAGKYGWVLTFGKGIIMSQSRMLEIARVVQPDDQLSYTGTGPNLSFMTGGWADMLVLILSCFTNTFSG